MGERSTGGDGRQGDACTEGREVPGALRCPHCGASLPDAWSPDHAGRCPTCRLVVGSGRATTQAGASAPTCAGFLARQARRSVVAPGDPGQVVATLLRVADELGQEPSQLRLIDYRRVQATTMSLPRIEVVLATFDSWKEARRTADEFRRS